tara:strand:- start:364 stop:534 length:171 start_codon:yes stop_codon:yes gene_type:complete
MTEITGVDVTRVLDKLKRPPLPEGENEDDARYTAKPPTDWMQTARDHAASPRRYSD